MPITSRENAVGQLLFALCDSPHSRRTAAKLTAAYGAAALAECLANGWTLATLDRGIHHITLKGRDALREINNAAVSETSTFKP